MYKVRYIATGMILWYGNAVVGIKGITLPEMFDDCDCYKLPGNAFDYSLAPNQEFTEEQKAFLDKSVKEWAEPEDEEEPEGESGPVDWMIRSDAFEKEDNNSWDDDDLPF